MVARKGTTSYALAAMDDVAINAWLYDKRIRRLTIDEISRLADTPANRNTETGHFSNDAGLGRKLSRSAVSRRVKVVLEEHKTDFGRDIDAARILELDALDRQAARLDDLVARFEVDNDGMIRPREAKQRLDAEMALLRISESRRKLLGLDAPAQMVVDAQVTTMDRTTIELAQMLARMP